MKRNTVKERLYAGETVLGTMVFEFAAPGIGQIASAAGAEFVIYDLEHSGFGQDTLRHLIRHAQLGDAIPMVRVPVVAYEHIARSLDLGACGVMLPSVERREQAELAVAASKYPPEGRRGTAFGVAHDDFTGGDVAAKMQFANAHTMVIAQIETVKGVENCDAIMAVPGVDVAWVGHFDLSASMGIPGEFEHPGFLEAMAHVAEVAARHGKAAGRLVPDVASGVRWQKAGYRALAYSGDIWIYQEGLRRGLQELRGQI